MVFCNNLPKALLMTVATVTILILIDGFLQFLNNVTYHEQKQRHNPYFNRWFSAILEYDDSSILDLSHNPYFNRWFSAICRYSSHKKFCKVTILILIDGFLQ